jgi:hypothetical protein
MVVCGRHKIAVEQFVEQYVLHLADQRRAGATARWPRYHLTKFAE